MKHLVAVSLCALAVVLAGCQTSAQETLPEETSAPESESVPEVTPEPEPPSPDSAPEIDTTEPTISLVPCSEGTREAIEATVVGQVDAFSTGDFEQAYQFASPGFQNGMPLDVFGTLIRLNYPQLLEATNARSGSCDADEDTGVSTIVMRFDTPSDPGYTLRYVLEYVGDQWRISGASREEVADTVASSYSATLSA